jgi:hypothetical protein
MKKSHSIFARIYGTNHLVHICTMASHKELQPIRLALTGARAFINMMTVTYDDDETLETAKVYYVQQMMTAKWNNVVKQPDNALVKFIEEG